MKKIIFVNPPLTLKDRYSSFDLGGTMIPPLGLANLAAATRANGYETQVIDGETLRLSCDSITEMIAGEKPEYVGITAVTLSVHKAAEISRLIKKKHPSAVIIVGGPHISAEPEKTFNMFPAFDIAVLGEGDNTILDLLDTLEKNKDLRGVKGILFRHNKSIVINEKRELIDNLDSLSLPAWDLLPDLRKYYKPPINAFNRFPVGYLVTSRGCYGRCIYCSRAVHKNKVRFYSAKYIVRMIVDLQEKYGVKEILFDDDEFLANKRRIERLAELFEKFKISISWSCLTRVKKADPRILLLMKKMGCWQISYGIESGDQKVLDFLKKDISLPEIENALTTTRKAGIRTKGFFMIGHAVDTHQSIQETIKFAKRIALDDLQSSVFTPLPGSEIYKTAHLYGQFNDNWEKMNYWNVVFVPFGLKNNDLKKYQNKLFREFYFRPRIIYSYLFSIRNGYQLICLIRAFVAFLKFILSPSKSNLEKQ